MKGGVTNDRTTTRKPHRRLTRATLSESDLPDPFDPARLALKGNPAETIGVKRVLAHVPVRKPNKQEFIRANPDPAYRIQMAILDLKTEGEIYAVLPEVAAALPGETRPVMLTTCVSRQGNVFLWPVPLPSSDGRELAWHTTARQAATRAETVWIRVVPNLGGGAYDIYEAPASIGDPYMARTQPSGSPEGGVWQRSSDRQPGPSGHQAIARASVSNIDWGDCEWISGQA